MTLHSRVTTGFIAVKYEPKFMNNGYWLTKVFDINEERLREGERISAIAGALYRLLADAYALMVRLTTRSKEYFKKQLRTHLPRACQSQNSASFSVILRHPIPVTYATQKWTQIPAAVLFRPHAGMLRAVRQRHVFYTATLRATIRGVCSCTSVWFKKRKAVGKHSRSIRTRLRCSSPIAVTCCLVRNTLSVAKG
jgi:hypothetical protein